MNKNKSIAILIAIAIVIVLGVVFAFVSLDDGQLGIYDLVSYPKAIKLGLDLKGGIYAVYEAEDDGSEGFADRLQGTADSMEQLLFGKGYTEAVVSVENGNRIRVEVPDVDDPDTIFTLIGRPASLEFKYKNLDGEIVTYENADGVKLTGKLLESAFVTLDDSSNYAIGLSFTDEGGKIFIEAANNVYNATGDYANGAKVLYIYVNGEEKVAPTVSTTMTSANAIITGNYTYETADAMAISLEAGSFAVNLQLIDSDVISPTLGEGALRGGIIAGAIGLAVIFIGLILLYGLLGVSASIALSLYTIIMLFFFAIFPWVQLTLPGIAGVIISIGMAVDANVIIFERIKDEYKNGNKEIRTAVREGFGRATSAIVDGNVTTIAGAIILLLIGSSAIKGFAITLIIGIVLSLISGLFFTRVIINCLLAFEDRDGAKYKLKRRLDNND